MFCKKNCSFSSSLALFLEFQKKKRKKHSMFSTVNAALWAESTAALEEDVSEDAYRLVRKPSKKGNGEGGSGARGERGKGNRWFRFRRRNC
jgi:hypothetical protein